MVGFGLAVYLVFVVSCLILFYVLDVCVILVVFFVVL